MTKIAAVLCLIAVSSRRQSGHSCQCACVALDTLIESKLKRFWRDSGESLGESLGEILTVGHQSSSLRTLARSGGSGSSTRSGCPSMSATSAAPQGKASVFGRTAARTQAKGSVYVSPSCSMSSKPIRSQNSKRLVCGCERRSLSAVFWQATVPRW